MHEFCRRVGTSSTGEVIFLCFCFFCFRVLRFVMCLPLFSLFVSVRVAWYSLRSCIMLIPRNHAKTSTANRYFNATQTLNLLALLFHFLIISHTHRNRTRNLRLLIVLFGVTHLNIVPATHRQRLGKIVILIFIH